MADSTTILALIETGQAQKEVTANQLFDAMSVAASYGRHAETCAGLVWGYYGTRFGGTAVANGTNTCGASTTTYMVVHKTTGAVTFATSVTNWDDGATYARAYKIVTGAATVSSYEDHRYGALGVGSVAAAGVTSVAASGGVETVSGTPITASGTLRSAFEVNLQTGTTYTYLTGDRGKLVSHSNAAAIAGTLPQSGSAGFESKWSMWVQNRGAGTLTITPTTSTIDGAATLVLTTNQGVQIFSGGANYYTMRGIGSAGSGDALTSGTLAQFAATTSAELASVISNETGSGLLVFGTSPTLVTPALGTPSALVLTNATGLPVAGGGTGVATLTAYAPVFGGTTGTGAVQSGTAGTAGHVLTSNGAGVLPTFQAVGASTTPVLIQLACSDETTALTAGTAKITFRAPYAFTLTDVRASVTTAPTGGTLLTVDVNESGTTVLSTKLTFDASEKTTTTAATPRVISDSAIADDAEMTVDIDAIGSTIAGAGLKITLLGTKP